MRTQREITGEKIKMNLVTCKRKKIFNRVNRSVGRAFEPIVLVVFCNCQVMLNELSKHGEKL